MRLVKETPFLISCLLFSVIDWHHLMVNDDQLCSAVLFYYGRYCRLCEDEDEVALFGEDRRSS